MKRNRKKHTAYRKTDSQTVIGVRIEKADLAIIRKQAKAEFRTIHSLVSEILARYARYERQQPVLHAQETQP